MAKDKRSGNASVYRHDQEAVQRPDVGVEAQFSNKKAPKTYRYDSSLAPELSWDENADRALAEWLLSLVADAAEKGESKVFTTPQVWAANGESFSSLSQCVARLRSLTKPFLNWTGKAERQQVTVSTLPLFVHERHSTQAILETLRSHKALGTNLDLFGDINLDVADKLDAYDHKGPWTNRLILGDSLQVMNSLLEYEGMGNSVQTIYFDPPYGVRYGSNFQPFVRRRKVEHGKDEEFSREPEMVKAYRDTWELGRHSYLTYMRDRCRLARDLLTDTGSIFVQISDENLHLVRAVLDEVFGEENFVAVINFKTMMPLESGKIESVVDYLCWYAKSKPIMKYHNIWVKKNVGKGSEFVFADDGGPDRHRRLHKEEMDDFDNTASKNNVFKRSDLASSGYTPSCTFPIQFDGQTFTTKRGKSWRTTKDGVARLEQQHRLFVLGQKLYFKMYLRDFGYGSLINQWTDTIEFGSRSYVVQTTPTVIERCINMTSDPGDLVFDLTCGSGTTAYCAEKWGRRWITCDTSRVPLALARQRLLTATFPWFRLQTPAAGPAGGFIYERRQNRSGEEIGGFVPRITLETLANDLDPSMVRLVDRPEKNDKITRVCGSFTVEATIQAAMSLEEDSGQQTPQQFSDNPRAYLDRMTELLRQSKTLQLPGNVTLQLDSISPLADREYLHAAGVAKNGSEKRIAFVFGPEGGAIGSEYVFNAHTEALQQGFQQLFLFGFAIQAKAREMLGRLKVPTTYVAVTPDVVMSDLLKTTKASEIFSITGLPDVTLEQVSKGKDGTQLHRVVIKGLDIFRPDTMETDEIKAENLPCWMLDSNYNGMVFMATQVFFPKTGAWENLQKSLKGQFSDSVWEHLAGTVSEPFVLGDKKRIAVKAIDERGNELMVVKAAEGGR
ncbi:possible DNA methylase [Nitrobacter sp. Nb-311A]|uniref:site-specific DNA-methyltransferase n=1 Tax=Nitrobacter sp. Nb-311A TaxID=314253 RepID=UPI0000686831|nr:site-specific DNA-methyltransferase [Nitrobacter sp. Nb-311A]EAQ33924.1 possible DNA methylase [Nitrobacter sp. Nb-311A]